MVASNCHIHISLLHSATVELLDPGEMERLMDNDPDIAEIDKSISDDDLLV